MSRGLVAGGIITLARNFASGWVVGIFLFVAGYPPQSADAASLSLNVLPHFYPPIGGQSADSYQLKDSTDSSKSQNSSATAAESRASQLRSSSLALIKKATSADLRMALKQLQESARLYHSGQFKTE